MRTTRQARDLLDMAREAGLPTVATRRTAAPAER